MRALLVLFLLSLPLVASGCAAPAPATTMKATVLEAKPVMPSGMAALEGYVVDDAFKPIRGATVHVGGIGRTLSVDDRGYYFTGAITPGTYRIGASAEGFQAHNQKAQAVSGKIGLYVFVLQSVPGVDEYQLVRTQRGFVACALAFAPPTMTQESKEAGTFVSLECGLPKVGAGGNDRSGNGNNPVEATDSSVRRWVLDQPVALWESAALVTRWTATHDLARVLVVEFGIDGCTDAQRTFASGEGVSPVIQKASEAEVRRVLDNGQGTTCTSPGERCDADSCVLSSHVRPSARPIGVEQVRAGAAFQQAFDQELTAKFSPAETVEGQTLK